MKELLALLIILFLGIFGGIGYLEYLSRPQDVCKCETFHPGDDKYNGV